MALFGTPHPHGENDGEKARALGDHAVRVLELHAPDQLRDFVQGTERGRPVWHGQAGIVAGDQGSRNDQEESPEGQQDSEPMKSAVVSCCERLQSNAPWVEGRMVTLP